MKSNLRSDKTCLNCGAYVEERYCPRCGQENIEIKESFGHLVSHFFNDLTHYDSKLLLSLKTLLLKPGVLTKEYLAGKRSTYLHPIRLYIFVSFVYFLISIGFNGLEERLEEAVARKASYDTELQIADSLRSLLSKGKNVSEVSRAKDSLLNSLIIKLERDSAKRMPGKDYVIVLGLTYPDLVSYDSAQRALPEEKRETGWKPWLYGRWLKAINHYGRGISVRVQSRASHFIPKMMFFMLPLFALLMKLFFSRGKYLYVDHAIFALHFHSASFLLFLIFSFFSLVYRPFAAYFEVAGLLAAFIYLSLAIRKVYNQSLGIAILKSTGLILLYSILFLIGYIVTAGTAMT